MDRMIRAQATVEQVHLPSGKSSLYRVHVTSPDTKVEAHYTIIEDDEDKAAMEGIRRFCEMIEPPPVGG
jgi:hypothetical protein